mgnify:CR=1 FL=1
MTQEYPGELAPIKENIEFLLVHLNDTMGSILQAADQVAAGADQVSTGAQALAQGSTEQASAVEELSATINDLDNSAQANRQTAQTAKEKADQAADQVRISNERMQEMRRAMSEILEGQKDISKIIETIENIAFQTNILALNAAWRPPGPETPARALPWWRTRSAIWLPSPTTPPSRPRSSLNLP